METAVATRRRAPVAARPVAQADSPSGSEDVRLKFSKMVLGLKGAKAGVLRSPLQTHNAVREQSLSYEALLHLISHLKGTKESEVAKVVGVSDRTLRRHREKPETPMSSDVAGKTLLFAQVLAQAVQVFGSQADAEEWLNRPALALANARPIELLQTVQGADLVKDQLVRLEYGVFS